MKQESYAQFTIEDVFTPFFHYERKILEGGEFSYVEVDRTPRTTGIRAFDAFLRCLEADQRTLPDIARTMRVNPRELSGLVHLLTDIPAGRFISVYLMHKVSLLLRYTDLPAAEVARYCRMGTEANMAQRLKDTYGETIAQRRYNHRQKYDLGRFLLRMADGK